SHKGRARIDLQKNFFENRVCYGDTNPGGIFRMRVVHRKVERRERELTSIKNAGGRFFGVVHFLNDVARNFLRWIAIIGGESIEHLFAPDPVLKHLRWRFYEIAGDMRSGETSGLRAGGNLVQRVT